MDGAYLQPRELLLQARVGLLLLLLGFLEGPGLRLSPAETRFAALQLLLSCR